MRVTSIREYQGRDIIEALLELLERAHEGKLRGFAFMVKVSNKRHRLGVTGDYWSDPYEALGCVTRLEFKLNELISSRDEEIETTTAPL